MRKSLKKKLCSRAGETIGETLVALLIAALALTMLAVMISSTVNMVTTGKEKMNSYYAASEALEVMNPEDPEAEEITVQLSGTNLSENQSAWCFSNNTFGRTDKAVYSYNIKSAS